jgi:hypothetical protein
MANAISSFFVARHSFFSNANLSQAKTKMGWLVDFAALSMEYRFWFKEVEPPADRRSNY